jgi:hypothetical protein
VAVPYWEWNDLEGKVRCLAIFVCCHWGTNRCRCCVSPTPPGSSFSIRLRSTFCRHFRTVFSLCRTSTMLSLAVLTILHHLNTLPTRHTPDAGQGAAAPVPPRQAAHRPRPSVPQQPSGWEGPSGRLRVGGGGEGRGRAIGRAAIPAEIASQEGRTAWRMPVTSLAAPAQT